MKKLLALLLAFAMVFSSITVAFADETTISADATACADLGMLVGDGNGVTAEYVAATPTRLQSAIMFLRLKGLEAEAKAFVGEENFADAANYGWAEGKAIMAYLKAHPELGWIGDGTNFNPAGKIDAKSYYKVMLEALGYKQNTTEVVGDFTWDNVVEFAATKGLTKVAAVETFTVDSLAAATVEALKANVKDTTKTLGTTLVEAGKIDAAKATTAGVYVAPVAELKVESVKATNLVEVVVEFNKAIDEDSVDDGDFIVDGTDVDADDVSVSEDGKVATLTIAAALENGEEIELEIDGITDMDENDFDGTFEFTPDDKEVPQALSVEFTGPETAKIKFSEPINEGEGTPEVSIDNGTYNPSIEAGYEGDYTVELNLGTELEEGQHSFKIKGFADYVPNGMAVKTITVEYKAIEEEVTVKVTDADQEEVTLEFNRPVTDIAVDDFYHTYSSWKPLAIEDADGDAVDADEFYDEIVLVFTDDDDNTTDRPIPVGTAKIVMVEEAVEDKWGNTNEKDVNMTATITADTTKPTVTKVTVEEENEIRVYFSENVVEDDANEDGNYVVKDSEGNVIKDTKWDAAGYDSDDDYVTITFDEDLDAGKYEITIEGIADTSLAGNAVDTVKFTFEITDVSEVDMAEVEADWIAGDKVLYVKYPEEMATTGAGSVLDEENYRLAGDELDDVKLSMFTSKIVKIVFPNDTADIEGQVLTIGRVADKVGNVGTALSTPITITDETAPTYEADSLKKIDENKFELTLNSEIKSIGSNAISVHNTVYGDAYASSVKFVNDDGEAIITITVSDNYDIPGTTVPAGCDLRIGIVADKIKSVTGVYVEAAANLGVIADDMAPEFAESIVDDDDEAVYMYDKDGDNKVDTVIVEYSEAIEADSVSKFTYTVEGYDIESVVVANAATVEALVANLANITAADGKFIVITVEEEDDNDMDETPAVTQRYTIEDVSGNELEAQEAVDSTDATSFMAEL